MKKIFIILSCILFFSFSYLPGTHSLAIGGPIPMAETKMKDISGKGISIKDAMQGKGVLVMFSCNTCPYVIRNQSRTKSVAAFAKQNHIGVILINSNEAGRSEGDSYTDMQLYAKQQGYDFFYAMDTNSRLADAFGATRTPEVYLFDARGILQYKGAIDDNPVDERLVKKAYAKEAISEMSSGKPVTVKESRSLGCAIRRL